MISPSKLLEYTKRVSILFVEDNEGLQMQMTNIFSDLFKEVVVASNGQIGLDVYTQRLHNASEPFDLVITDINMPIMNGIDMIKKIYEIIPDQQVIVTSAYNNTEYLIELLNLGVSSFLMKPLNAKNMSQSFFSASKAIINEKLVKEKNSEIQSLNQALSIKTEELECSNLELLEKNIALEKSMKIIEGYHHNKKMSENVDFKIKHDIKVEAPLVTQSIKNIEEPLDPNNHLKKIELIICNISMKYDFNGIESDLLQRLSNEIIAYCDTIGEEKVFIKLKNLLKQLSVTVYHRPVCTKEEALNKIFTMIESFFYVYSKLQEQWKSIDDEKIALSIPSIENELETIISHWTCKKQ